MVRQGGPDSATPRRHLVAHEGAFPCAVTATFAGPCVRGVHPCVPQRVSGARRGARGVRVPSGVGRTCANGAPAGRIDIDGQPAAVSLVVESGWVTQIFVMGNPRKLARLGEPAELAR